MNIRPARESELPRLMELFDIARAYMRRNGNTVQWVNGYPSEDLIRQDIAQDRAFVVEEAGIAEAVFCYLTGRHVEPTYAVIHGGAWPGRRALRRHPPPGLLRKAPGRHGSLRRLGALPLPRPPGGHPREQRHHARRHGPPGLHGVRHHHPGG